MEKKESLYIPMGIKEKNEYWEGFGAKELRGALMFIFAVTIINIIISLTKNSIIFFMGVLILSIATGLMVFTKSNVNLSVVDQIKHIIDFNKSQKVYYYKSLDEWR